MDMRLRHRRTLERIFASPTPSDIRWAEVESLLRAVDVEITERAGARVLLRKEGERMVVHRPHPRPELLRSVVRRIAGFLDTIGVNPDGI